MKVLITGASGFVAPYLEKELRSHGHRVSKTALQAFIKCDLTNKKAVLALIRKTRPDAIVHLAGLSQTNESQFSYQDYVHANVLTTFNLCAAYSGLRGKKLFLFVSSGMVFGSGRNKAVQFSESSSVNPITVYGETKWMAEQSARLFENRDMKVFVARPFNHIGPGQPTSFVTSAFAERIAHARLEGQIPVGDLSAARDFTDVRDIVRAYRLILEKQPRQRLFVLGSGRAIPIGFVLKTLIKISGKAIRVKGRSSLSTSRKISSLRSRPALALRVLKWKARISLEASLRDIYKSKLK